MDGFREFVMKEFEIRGVKYRPGFSVSNVLPKTGFRAGGAAHMNPFQSIQPSRPYQPNFRMGKSAIKSQIALKK
jgi:hypothetical protein